MTIPYLNNASPWLSIPLVFLVWVLVLSIVKKIVFSIAKKFAERTKTQLDDVLFEAMDFPVQLLIFGDHLHEIYGAEITAFIRRSAGMRH